MPRILVTNDDGVHSEGIRALADALRPIGDVTVVAPIQEASAIGHALTLWHPLRLDRLDMFTEGFDTPDLVEARCLHDGIARGHGAGQ